jgi:hypothetical protein
MSATLPLDEESDLRLGKVRRKLNSYVKPRGKDPYEKKIKAILSPSSPTTLAVLPNFAGELAQTSGVRGSLSLCEASQRMTGQKLA